MDKIKKDVVKIFIYIFINIILFLLNIAKKTLLNC